MYLWLHEAIAANAQVVTASRRLALELRVAYDEAQIAQGEKSWLTPAINAWPDWLADQINNAIDAESVPARIDTFSAAVLWEKCLQELVAQDILNFAGTARQTKQAWQQVCDWAIPLEALRKSAGNADEKLFARVAHSYHRQLENSNWVDNARLPAVVSQLITDGVLQVSGNLLFAGFDRLSPIVSGMVNVLRAGGCQVDVQQQLPIEGTISIAALQNEQSELRTAGAWARGILDKDPKAKIAIVKSNLESSAENSLRLVLEGLVPGWQLGGKAYRSAANVSYGQKLTEFAAIHVALLLLSWMSRGLNTRQISVLLRSKSIGSGVTQGRCRIEHEIRKLPERKWTIASFISAVRRLSQAPDVEMFIAAITKCAERLTNGESVRGPAAWAEEIDALLQLLDWPGTQVLDSEEFQLVNRWRKLLNEFSRTSVVTPRLTFSEAVQRLTAMAAETVYQAETRTNAVQLLGTLEAAGMQFDAIWICGLDAAQWPAPGRPSPYVSRALQRKHQMPDATPADTLKFSHRVLHRLLGSAPRRVFSWSLERDDTEMTVSPLLDEFVLAAYDGPDDRGWFASRSVSPSALMDLEDRKAPPVRKDERVRGGAYTIQRQSQEPFSAFVHARLGVTHAEMIAPGISPRQRGILTHDALHNLLSDCPNQHEIGSWSGEERQQRIGSAVDGAISGLLRFADSALEHVLRLERKRLMNLLEAFIERETERPEFSIVGVESAISYARGELQLGLRVDRIDALPDGSILIIDYKTGAPRGFLNKDDEPADLQLVVYADAVKRPVGGLSIINIDSKQITYKGAGADLAWQKANVAPWPGRLENWLQIVHRAMDDFISGDVRINLAATSANTRPLQILSRIEELKRGN